MLENEDEDVVTGSALPAGGSQDIMQWDGTVAGDVVVTNNAEALARKQRTEASVQLRQKP